MNKIPNPMKAIAPRICLTLLAGTLSVTAQVVVFDDFDDGDADEWTVISGEWAVSGGQYEQTNPYHNGWVTPYRFDMIALAGHLELNSFSVDVTASRKPLVGGSTGWHGIVFRFQDTSNYETMLYWSNSNEFWIEYWTFVNQSWRFVDGVPVNGLPDDPHRLSLMVDGTELSVYHNGDLAASFVDTTGLNAGGVGLYTEGLGAAFDDWCWRGPSWHFLRICVISLTAPICLKVSATACMRNWKRRLACFKIQTEITTWPLATPWMLS